MQVTCLDTLDLNIHDLWKINEMFIAEQEAFNTKIEVLIELVRELELSDLIRKNTDFLCLNALAVNIYDEVLNKVLCFALEI